MTLGVILWSVFGEIYTRVAGLGVALPSNGNVEQVLSEGAGPVSQVTVSLGQRVVKGETIALINQAVLQQQLVGVENDLSTAKSIRAKRGAEIASDAAAQQKSTAEQIATLEAKIKSLNDLIAFRKNYLGDLQGEETQGFTTKLAVQQAQSDIASSQIDLSTAQDQITQAKNQLAAAKAAGEKELQQLDQNVQQLQDKEIDLKTQLGLSGRVVAPDTGRIVDIATAPGSVLNVGQVVATIAPDKNGLDVVAFFQVGDGKRIALGANALIAFDSVDPDVYGTANGTVTSIGAVPETPQSLLNTLGNRTLVQQLAPGFAPLEVHIKLKPDPADPKRYAFSSGRQPPFDVTTGTTARILVLVSKDRPITYVLPIMRDLLGR